MPKVAYKTSFQRLAGFKYSNYLNLYITDDVPLVKGTSSTYIGFCIRFDKNKSVPIRLQMVFGFCSSFLYILSSLFHWSYAKSSSLSILLEAVISVTKRFLRSRWSFQMVTSVSDVMFSCDRQRIMQMV